MGLGLKGPFGRERLVEYAVATILTETEDGRSNQNTVHCKVCGEGVAKGEGVRFGIREMQGPHWAQCYFCEKCAEWARSWLRCWNTFQAQRRKESENG